jgi:hypothetical protein
MGGGDAASESAPDPDLESIEPGDREPDLAGVRREDSPSNFRKRS